jgi:serine/threonine protein kinase
MLSSGTKLGPYEILSPLGAGGMGEVYRATDTKLNRHVAIKVLPAEVAGDPERLARFKREAEAHRARLDRHPGVPAPQHAFRDPEKAAATRPRDGLRRRMAGAAVRPGASICSTDGDFERFPGVERISPLR